MSDDNLIHLGNKREERILSKPGKLDTLTRDEVIQRLEHAREELECIDVWLNAQYAPTHDDGVSLSRVGRIKHLIRKTLEKTMVTVPR